MFCYYNYAISETPSDAGQFAGDVVRQWEHIVGTHRERRSSDTNVGLSGHDDGSAFRSCCSVLDTEAKDFVEASLTAAAERGNSRGCW